MNVLQNIGKCGGRQRSASRVRRWWLGCSVLVSAGVGTLWAQSPFATGAQALEVDLIDFATPVAVLAVIVLGIAAWFNVVRWGWVVGVMAGTVLVFGSTQVVDWVRGMFAV